MDEPTRTNAAVEPAADQAEEIKYGPVAVQPEEEAEPDPADSFLAAQRPSFWNDLN